MESTFGIDPTLLPGRSASFRADTVRRRNLDPLFRSVRESIFPAERLPTAKPEHFLRDVSRRLCERRIKYRQDVQDGPGNASQTLIGLPEGNNFGKLPGRAKQRLLWITELHYCLRPAKGGFSKGMSNVIPFSSRSKQRTPAASSADEERAALAAHLIELLDQVREVTGRVATLSGPQLQVEQTAQHLLDAATALECAADALTEGGEWVPF